MPSSQREAGQGEVRKTVKMRKGLGGVMRGQAAESPPPAIANSSAFYRS